MATRTFAGSRLFSGIGSCAITVAPSWCLKPSRSLPTGRLTSLSPTSSTSTLPTSERSRRVAEAVGAGYDRLLTLEMVNDVFIERLDVRGELLDGLDIPFTSGLNVFARHAGSWTDLNARVDPPCRRCPGYHGEAHDARRSDARAGRSAPSSTPKPSAATAHYEHPGDVPLKPGQVLALEAKQGYYAAGRPNPEKASSTPAPSTTRVTALSTRASTESPLKEHVETRDGRTTITLSHATKPGEKTSQEKKVAAHVGERTAKPRTSADRDHATVRNTKKASSRVHDQVGKSKNRSHHTESKIKHHPGRPKRGPLASAASAGDRDRHRGPRLPDASRQRGMPWKASATLDTAALVVESSLQASFPLAEVAIHNGDVVVSIANQPLLTIPLGPLNANFVNNVAAEVSHLQQALTKTYTANGITLHATLTLSGMSLATTSHGITTTLTVKLPDTIEISTTGTVYAPAKPPLKPVPIKVDVTTTITPRQPGGGSGDGTEPKGVLLRETKPAPAHHHSFVTSAIDWLSGAAHTVGGAVHTGLAIDHNFWEHVEHWQWPGPSPGRGPGGGLPPWERTPEGPGV